MEQTTNIFFGEVIMQMKDKWWDIFEFFEYDVSIFEKSFAQTVQAWTGDKKQSDRQYFRFYLRADQKLFNYKREEYDLL